MNSGAFRSPIEEVKQDTLSEQGHVDQKDLPIIQMRLDYPQRFVTLMPTANFVEGRPQEYVSLAQIPTQMLPHENVSLAPPQMQLQLPPRAQGYPNSQPFMMQRIKQQQQMSFQPQQPVGMRQSTSLPSINTTNNQINPPATGQLKEDLFGIEPSVDNFRFRSSNDALRGKPDLRIASPDLDMTSARNLQPFGRGTLNEREPFGQDEMSIIGIKQQQHGEMKEQSIKNFNILKNKIRVPFQMRNSKNPADIAAKEVTSISLEQLAKQNQKRKIFSNRDNQDSSEPISRHSNSLSQPGGSNDPINQGSDFTFSALGFRSQAARISQRMGSSGKSKNRRNHEGSSSDMEKRDHSSQEDNRPHNLALPPTSGKETISSGNLPTTSFNASSSNQPGSLKEPGRLSLPKGILGETLAGSQKRIEEKQFGGEPLTISKLSFASNPPQSSDLNPFATVMTREQGRNPLAQARVCEISVLSVSRSNLDFQEEVKEETAESPRLRGESSPFGPPPLDQMTPPQTPRLERRQSISMSVINLKQERLVFNMDIIPPERPPEVHKPALEPSSQLALIEILKSPKPQPRASYPIQEEEKKEEVIEPSVALLPVQPRSLQVEEESKHLEPDLPLKSPPVEPSLEVEPEPVKEPDQAQTLLQKDAQDQQEPALPIILPEEEKAPQLPPLAPRSKTPLKFVKKQLTGPRFPLRRGLSLPNVLTVIQEAEPQVEEPSLSHHESPTAKMRASQNTQTDPVDDEKVKELSLLAKEKEDKTKETEEQLSNLQKMQELEKKKFALERSKFKLKELEQSKTIKLLMKKRIEDQKNNKLFMNKFRDKLKKAMAKPPQAPKKESIAEGAKESSVEQPAKLKEPQLFQLPTVTEATVAKAQPPASDLESRLADKSPEPPPKQQLDLVLQELPIEGLMALQQLSSMPIPENQFQNQINSLLGKTEELTNQKAANPLAPGLPPLPLSKDPARSAVDASISGKSRQLSITSGKASSIAQPPTLGHPPDAPLAHFSQTRKADSKVPSEELMGQYQFRPDQTSDLLNYANILIEQSELQDPFLNPQAMNSSNSEFIPFQPPQAALAEQPAGKQPPDTKLTGHFNDLIGQVGDLPLDSRNPFEPETVLNTVTSTMDNPTVNPPADPGTPSLKPPEETKEDHFQMKEKAIIQNQQFAEDLPVVGSENQAIGGNPTDLNDALQTQLMNLQSQLNQKEDPTTQVDTELELQIDQEIQQQLLALQQLSGLPIDPNSEVPPLNPLGLLPDLPETPMGTSDPLSFPIETQQSLLSSLLPGEMSNAAAGQPSMQPEAIDSSNPLFNPLANLPLGSLTNPDFGLPNATAEGTVQTPDQALLEAQAQQPAPINPSDAQAQRSAQVPTPAQPQQLTDAAPQAVASAPPQIVSSGQQQTTPQPDAFKAHQQEMAQFMEDMKKKMQEYESKLQQKDKELAAYQAKSNSILELPPASPSLKTELAPRINQSFQQSSQKHSKRSSYNKSQIDLQQFSQTLGVPLRKKQTRKSQVPHQKFSGLASLQGSKKPSRQKIDLDDIPLNSLSEATEFDEDEIQEQLLQDGGLTEEDLQSMIDQRKLQTKQMGGHIQKVLGQGSKYVPAIDDNADIHNLVDEEEKEMLTEEIQDHIETLDHLQQLKNLQDSSAGDKANQKLIDSYMKRLSSKVSQMAIDTKKRISQNNLLSVPGRRQAFGKGRNLSQIRKVEDIELPSASERGTEFSEASSLGYDDEDEQVQQKHQKLVAQISKKQQKKADQRRVLRRRLERQLRKESSSMAERQVLSSLKNEVSSSYMDAYKRARAEKEAQLMKKNPVRALQGNKYNQSSWGSFQ